MQNTNPAYHHIVHWQGISYSPADFRLFIKEKLKSNIEDWERDIYRFLRDWMDEKKEQFEVQTSGSTGEAKTIRINRRDMIKSANRTASFLSLQYGQSSLLCLPAKYIAGKMMIVRALAIGMQLYYEAPKLNVSQYIDRKYDFCAMIPLQIQYALDHQLQGSLDEIANIIIGGAALSTYQIEELQKQQSNIFATYGMTETITHIALRKINGPDKIDYFACLDGIRVEKNEEECLVIHTENLGSFTSNDIADIISPKRFNILGRKDFIINSGGLKINPEQLEQRIVPLVPFPFMIGYKNDNILGQKLVILLETNDSSYSFNTLLDDIKQLVSSKYSPKEAHIIPKLFTTPNHKIDRLRCNKYLCQQVIQ